MALPDNAQTKTMVLSASIPVVPEQSKLQLSPKARKTARQALRGAHDGDREEQPRNPLSGSQHQPARMDRFLAEEEQHTRRCNRQIFPFSMSAFEKHLFCCFVSRR